MPILASDLRRQLENICIAARDKAEEAAQSALRKCGVDAVEPHAHFKAADKQLRNRLRARGRQVGDVRHSNKKQDIDQLTQELAYEYWHRMLFARFLAENHLLMHPDGVAVSLEECEELAKAEEAPNGFVLAARYASKMLPQIFRVDDVLMEVEFAPEHRIALEKLLAKLPTAVFTASDALGWVYQFWQSKRKDDVNRSEVKIGAKEISAVTQLFTEPYMVEFLLHNTLGAWWAGKNLTAQDTDNAATEEELRRKLALPGVSWDYLRFVRGDDGQGGPWRPAAGMFDGWPIAAKDVKVLDPCCGSGHFLVAALRHLVPIRMAEEGLSAADAVDAVLRDNLHGLEIDERCCQIAAFALAFEAWKLTGYRPLPELHIACSGLGPQCSAEEWLELVERSGIPMPRGGRDAIRNGLENLHYLFSQAPTLGSLIDPTELPANVVAADFETIQPYLAAIFRGEMADEETRERAIAAAGMVKAGELLAGEYTLVITNVPYLGRGKQGEVLKEYLDHYYFVSKFDLATAFVQRAFELSHDVGSVALVAPQNWLFLTSYGPLRQSLLEQHTWNFVARLGPRAFETIGGEVVMVALLIATATSPATSASVMGLDASELRSATEKAHQLAVADQSALQKMSQRDMLDSPDARIAFGTNTSHDRLEKYVICKLGLGTGDAPHYLRQFWEVSEVGSKWHKFQTGTDTSDEVAGCDSVVAWDDKLKRVAGMSEAERRRAKWQDYRGAEAWGHQGVAVSLVSGLKTCGYNGHLFDKSIAAIVPLDPTHLGQITCFVRSDQFIEEVRKLDQKLMVTNSTLAKVPFDLAFWQSVAAERYPHGIPVPHSDDPAQWLFTGDIVSSADPIQVAVARLLGYRWPDQPETLDGIDKVADIDGLVCVPGVRGEAPASERLLEVLHVAYGKKWSNALLHDLLADASSKPGMTLDDWLRNAYFEQHCKLFHHRPFLWHLWDGRKDGFSCLVNYHKLNHKALETLTYAYLGDWIKAQAAEAKAGKTGADLRLGAAQEMQAKLKLILTGEPPYDIFVRWKPLAEQAIGWHPDLNDGVRMNIRPFMEAGILRKNPNIKWTKDRGKESERDKDEFPWFWNGQKPVGDRVNDVHLTNAEKQAARKRAP